jgi:hypothetical protein
MSLIIPANTLASGGFSVDNSVRFNSGSSDYLNRTPSSAGNRRTFTFSFWVKRATLGTSQFIYNVRPGAPGASQMLFASGDKLQFSFEPISKSLQTNRLFRDISAWYHIVYAFDTTQGTASNRIKLYVNGVQETSFDTANYPDQNADLDINTTNVINIGRRLETSGSFIDMYLSEFVFIDGQALAPTSFGEFDEDSGIWKPIDVSGLTFGTNGFYLDFENSGALGADVSGNTNNFTVNNLTAIDQSTDTCTNNFATLNPLAPMDTGSSVQALSEGNLQANGPAEGVGWQTAYATIPLSSGKWYIEVLVIQVAGNEVVIGLNPDNFSNTSDTAHSNSTAGVWYQSNGGKWVSGSSSSYGATYDDGDIISVLINMDDSEVTFYKNDASQGTISFNTNLTAASSIIFGTNGVEVTSITQFNFGSPPYAISSGNQDGNGYGNFEFATKGGYALNTKNLSEFG